MPDLNLRGIVSTFSRRCVLRLTRRYAEDQDIAILRPLWRRVRSHAHVFREGAVFAEIVGEAGWTGRRDAFPGEDRVALIVKARILFAAAVDGDIVALFS